jgi:hypothetical protein
MKKFLNLGTLSGLATKRRRPYDVIIGAGVVLLLWAFLYYLLGFEFNYQHVFEVLIGVIGLFVQIDTVSGAIQTDVRR